MSTRTPLGNGTRSGLSGELAGRRALVFGLGTFGGGLGVTRWLARAGARVCVTDLRDAALLGPSLAALEGLPVSLVLGEHRPEDFGTAELVVANPAVPPSSPWLALARAHGARVTSEIELFLERVPASVLAITGTQGKSSACSMLHQLLVGAGWRAHLGGNIGGSLLESLERIEPADHVVLELSSYQLESLPTADGCQRGPGCVRVAGITNVLADHLERHGDAEAYCRAKARLLARLAEDGAAVLPRGDGRLVAPRGREVRHGLEPDARDGLRVRADRFLLDEEALGRVSDLHLPGGFQVQNALVALGMARLAGVPAERLAALVPSLSGLPHRMQELGFHAGVRVVDNGVSTTPDSTRAVLSDVPRGASLLVGGQAKRLPLEALASAARERALRVFAFGAARAELARAFAAAGCEAEAHATLEAATQAALAATAPGGTLLFSPACASFDAFPNFQARARHFHALLQELRP